MKKTATLIPLLLAAALMLTGCAGKSADATRHPGDPIEGFNRPVHGFNDGLDTIILEPAAKGYLALPQFMQTGISNFGNWVGHPSTAVNSLLQGRIGNAGRALRSFIVGLPTIGFYEPFKPEHRPEGTGFDQTIAKIIPPGPYLVLPVFGPGTVRTHTAGFLGGFIDPLSYAKQIREVRDKNVPVRTIETAGTVASVVSFRANNFDLINNIKYESVDPYARTRAVFLQSVGRGEETSPEEVDNAFDDFLEEEETQ